LFLDFLVQNGAFWCIFVFLSNGRAPKRRGAWGSLPPTPPSRPAWIGPIIPMLYQDSQVPKKAYPYVIYSGFYPPNLESCVLLFHSSFPILGFFHPMRGVGQFC